MGNGPVGMILGAVGGFVVGGPAGAAVFIGSSDQIHTNPYAHIHVV